MCDQKILLYRCSHWAAGLLFHNPLKDAKAQGTQHRGYPRWQTLSVDWLIQWKLWLSLASQANDMRIFNCWHDLLDRPNQYCHIFWPFVITWIFASTSNTSVVPSSVEKKRSFVASSDRFVLRLWECSLAPEQGPKRPLLHAFTPRQMWRLNSVHPCSPPPQRRISLTFFRRKSIEEQPPHGKKVVHAANFRKNFIMLGETVYICLPTSSGPEHFAKQSCIPN